jgi:DNA/RNA-binding domain of Phe-tRNA-synthetase-like protein
MPDRMIYTLSEAWKTAFPDAHVGILVMHGVTNPPVHPELELRKRALEHRLRARFAGGDRKSIEALPAILAYTAYYKPFKKTYHVQHQLESIAFKGKGLPSVAGLVEAMFMAELNNQLLTAGHDLDVVRLPITVHVSEGTERYVVLRGEEQALKAGDMFIADQQGVISNILYGPDQRTRLTAGTRNALFTVYAPRGIPAQAVHDHLQEIREYADIVSPDARVELLRVVGAGGSRGAEPVR